MKKVLIVEDDRELIDLIEIHLKDLDCQVTKAYNGKQGLDAALAEPFDLVVLDVAMPEMDGFEVCKRVRSEKNVPIIMLTAKSEEIDRVIGLELGADDYITKPFSVREFLARVKAVWRRVQLDEVPKTSALHNEMILDGLSINIEQRRVNRDGKKVELSPKEFDLLALMASNPGKNYSRANLLSLIWGYDFEGYEHTVNSHINRLRAKIEPEMNNPSYIITTWGVGYKFNEEMI